MMKGYKYIVAVGLGIAVVIATQQVRAAGADGWDALGVVSKLQNKITALEARVAELERGGPLGDSLAVQRRVIELERKVEQLEKGAGVAHIVVNEVPNAQAYVPLQPKSQDEILQVFKRGMFVPAK